MIMTIAGLSAFIFCLFIILLVAKMGGILGDVLFFFFGLVLIFGIPTGLIIGGMFVHKYLTQ
jgi:hypothetical protein